jgi:Flp pilus assembly protein TadD
LAKPKLLYAQVLAANPDDPTALVNAGAVALARGEFALAIARFERVVRLAPAMRRRGATWASH